MITETNAKYYYAGIMQYYEATNDGAFKHVVTDAEISAAELCAAPIEEKLETVRQITYTQRRDATSNPAPVDYVHGSEPDYYCTITGIANLLQYYGDFMDSDMYASSTNSAETVREYLKENEYIYATGALTLTQAKSSHTKQGVTYKGLQRYFNLVTVDDYTANTAYADIDDIKYQIDDCERPVLINISAEWISDTTTGSHIVMAYRMNSAGTYFIVNDNWNHNTRHLYIDDMNSSNYIMYLN